MCHLCSGKMRTLHQLEHATCRHGRKPIIHEDALAVLPFPAEEPPDATLSSPAEMLDHETEVSVSRQAIRQALNARASTRSRGVECVGAR